MASKELEQNESSFALKEQHGQQEQQEDDGLGFHEPTKLETRFGYSGASQEASISAENKWNKNSFGHGVQIRTGKYSKEETEAIKAAVHEYCAMKQITVHRLCSECDHKADLKGSWMEIAKCLPHRSVQSVYRHGLRQLHPFKRGAWTEEECQLLEDSVAMVGKKWAHIQSKLNRSADACRDKYREMGIKYRRGRWRENETEQLKRLIREYLRVDPRADIKELGKMVQAEQIKISWSVISKRMEKRSRLSCFKKWQKMTGLFSPSDIPRLGGNSKNVETAEEMTETVVDPTSEAKEVVSVVEEGGDIDIFLLSELISMDAVKASDVSWGDLRVENAQERWYEMMEDWQSNIMDDSLLALPLSEIAQLILNSKTSAQRAAETVEAVDLPATF